ncbi:unnamed protein product [Pieris brassicae]|uniref:F-box domain-containing protein n=1 Tax=Pieris brassicae TaxID=7116 RepID=A0A9P0TM74_PIEBR|nr:unnamed protein product [Pieris brassicae]
MDIHSELVEPLSPRISYNNSSSYWKSEDSGYHTSFTPGSLECSEVSNDSINSTFIKGRICFRGPYQVDYFNISPDDLVSHANISACIRNNDSFKDSPKGRRGIKRPFPDELENIDIPYNSIPTPTTLIAGGLRKLKFNDTKPKASKSFGHTDDLHEFYNLHEKGHTFPSTPIKKTCRTNCHLNSPTSLKRPAKKLNFAIHSLSCEAKGLQPVTKVTKSKAVKSIQFRPEQKIDIIKMLYEKVNMRPPLMKIFSYLSNEDIFNFTLVSPLWLTVWENISKTSKLLEYRTFLRNVEENVENRDVKPKILGSHQKKPLSETNNIIVSKTQPVSPPDTPRTIKFKRFTKAASLDLRKQLSCVRCHQPAKVTEESSGEEWVECTSVTCSYQYCKFCKCDRHPGKKCFKYDLDGPSPSKRKKNTYAIGTKKSRKNLRRLL